MRAAFTLIELLVVLVILTLVMAVVVPQGAKMLSGYEHTLARIEAKQQLSRAKARAFLQAKDRNIMIEGKHYVILKKGIVVETRHDHD